jgi:hypothetical protein
VSNGSEPNLSSRGGNPSLAASSGFELDESDEVDVQPLPFRWIPVLFRPGGVEAVAAVNFGVESWEEKKGQCGSAGPERKGRRDSGGRRSWEKRRELVREKNASSAHRERGGGGGGRRTEETTQKTHLRASGENPCRSKFCKFRFCASYPSLSRAYWPFAEYPLRSRPAQGAAKSANGKPPEAVAKTIAEPS